MSTEREQLAARVTREEHLAECKRRALKCLDDGDLHAALASFTDDMRKHPGTDTVTTAHWLSTEGIRCAIAGDAEGMRALISKFP